MLDRLLELVMGAVFMTGGILLMVFRVRAAAWDGWYDSWWRYMIKRPRTATAAEVAGIGALFTLVGAVCALVSIVHP